MLRPIGKFFLILLVGLILIAGTLTVVFYQPEIPVDQLRAKYAVSPSRFDSVMGMNVHFRDEGPAEDSVPLVLLHGTSSSLLTWNACVKEWSVRHRVVRMDLPGFGLTGPRPDGDYSIEMYVSFLERFLEARHIRRCYLAGNSLGGLISVQYAVRFPERVKKLILIDAAGYPIKNYAGNLGFRLARMPVIRNIVAVVTPFSLVRKSVEDVYGDKSLVTDELVTQYRDLTCREGNRDALIARLNSNQKPDTTLIAGVATPTLILWGDQDKLIPIGHAGKFHRDLRKDTVIILKGVGHVPMEESPVKVADAVEVFLN